MKKILALVITLVIFSTLSVPCKAVGDTTKSQWIPVSFSSSISTDTQNKMMIKWDWNDLLTDATTSGENSDLAIAGLVMSNQAEFSKDDVEEVLNTMGFEDISSQYYSTDTKDTSYISNPARTFAHREIDVNGEKKHIICAVIRGTRSVVDAITDIKSVRDGFLDAGENCLESLKEYQGSLKGATKENTILFITGHSLGASTACVLSCLADEVAYKSATHTYAIATPNYDTMELESKDCQNIHMYTNLDDIVPKVPLYFKKVGVEKSYSYDTLSSEERAGFDRVYKYFRGKTYTEDGDISSTDLIGQLRDHMGFTYMSFMLSEKSDSEIDNYIASYETPIDGDINQSLLGDVNSDGYINIKDATMIQKCVAGIEKLDENQSICADTNGDGTITVHDATLIQKYVVKLIVKL
ncbi:MAG: dockerin type I domain-containing protein [Ruminococcus sp.]